MTVFGPDVSSFQGGINIGALGTPFILLKCTEGTHYTDAYYERWLAQAKSAGMITIPYHFVTGEDPDAQAKHLLANISDKTLPVMLDWEPEGNYKPPLAQLYAVADAMTRRGLRPKLAYAPRWHWANIGSPDLTGLGVRRMGLVSSAYPGGQGYPGDRAAGWQAYGGETPLLYQYTDVAVVGGQRVGDMNAYRGTIQQWADFLGTPSSSAASAPQGGTVGTIPPSISAKWPELAGDFPPNATFTDESALIWADGGARAAALYALQARDAINALASKITTPPPVVPIDTAALAKALAPLLQTSPTADQVATAVVAHLATTLGKATP